VSGEYNVQTYPVMVALSVMQAAMCSTFGGCLRNTCFLTPNVSGG
jgi:hypothetical protein